MYVEFNCTVANKPILILSYYPYLLKIALNATDNPEIR